MITATRALPCILAAAALAAPAAAQFFDGRVAFRDDHGTNNDPNVPEVIEFFAPGGTYQFSILLGAFDAQDFTNYGMFNWNGSLSVAGGGATIAPVSLRGPFTQNPAGLGVVSPDGTTISGIDAARPITNVAVPWNFGDPQPTEPPTFTQGNNAYFQTYRFALHLTDLTPRDIVVTASGAMEAVSGWTQVGINDPELDVPGSVNWAGTSTVQDSTASGTFIIRILVPAPGATALLGLGGLMAARRRRG